MLPQPLALSRFNFAIRIWGSYSQGPLEPSILISEHSYLSHSEHSWDSTRNQLNSIPLLYKNYHRYKPDALALHYLPRVVKDGIRNAIYDKVQPTTKDPLLDEV